MENYLVRKILIINRLGIGDVVLTTPLAQLLKENIENIKIGFLIADKASDLLKNHMYIDDVFSYKHKEKTVIINQIKKAAYTDAIIVDGRLNSTILALRAGCHLLNKGYCISINRRHFFPRKELNKRAIEDFSMYAKLLFNINFDKTNLLPKIGDCDAKRQLEISNWVEKNKQSTKKIVLIVARTAADIKNWNPTELGKLNIYLNTHGINPVYIGSPNDAEYIKEIAGNKINMAGKLSLRDIPEIAKYASWALSMCTGPLHILGTVKDLPIIAIYGPSDPLRWAPTDAIVVQSDLSCVPCQNWDKCDKPKGHTCMDQIKFEQIKKIIIEKNLL